MPSYSVLAVTPTNDDWVAGYIAAVNGIVSKHGGRYLARTTAHEQLEGPDQPAGLRVIIEWPSAEAAKAFMADPEYADPLKARLDGAHNLHFLIEGRDDTSL